MKKQLLLGALLSAGLMAFVPAMNAKSSMDASLSMKWMVTGDIPTLKLDARQGTAANGKFYLQNKATGKVEVWDATGKINEITSGGGTNITRDDAANIIVRVGTFNTDYVSTRDELMIIPTEGASKSIPLSGITKGRLDFWGHVSGNVMDATDGGVLYMGTIYGGNIIEIPIKDGAQDVANTYQYSYRSPFAIPGNITTTSLMSSWKGVEDLAVLSPYATGNTTSCNSIEKMGYDGDDNWVHKAFYITPRHNNCTGFDIFKIGDQKYIVYSTGGNNGDGFSVARLATKEASAFEDSDEAYRVATKYAETKEDNNVMYQGANSYYGNHLIAEVNTDGKTANIYQYFPGGYIAQYVFDPSKSGVDGIQNDAEQTIIIGGEGEITIEGNPASIEVYTIGGVLVSRNEANVKCAPGIYVVRTNGNVAKVLVK